MTAQSKPSGLLVAGSAVILTGDWLETAFKALLVAERTRRLNRLPDNEAERYLAAALRKAMSARPQTDGPKPAAAQTNTRWLTTQKAAEMLGCTERHARRIAPQLDGIREAGSWHIPETAITEHLEGKQL